MLSEDSNYEKLQKEDILIKINNKLLTQFVHLNAILNSSMSKNVHLLVQQEEQDLKLFYIIQNLHKITSACFITVADINFQNLLYQLIRYYATVIHDVYLYHAIDLFDFLFNYLINSVNNRSV